MDKVQMPPVIQDIVAIKVRDKFITDPNEVMRLLSVDNKLEYISRRCASFMFHATRDEHWRRLSDAPTLFEEEGGS